MLTVGSEKEIVVELFLMKSVSRCCPFFPLIRMPNFDLTLYSLLFSLIRHTGPFQSLSRDVRELCLCVCVLLQKTRFPVKECIANIGTPLDVFGFFPFL